MKRAALAVPAVGLLVACTPAVTPQPALPTAFTPVSGAAIAYLQSHPVATPPGFIAGIVLSESAAGPVPPATSGTWSQSLVTATGRVITIRCRTSCSWGPPMPLGAAGSLGAYEIVPVGGDASVPGDVRIIKAGAVA